MNKTKALPAIMVIAAICISIVLFQKNSYGQNTGSESSMLIDEFKRVIPDIQRGKKTLSVFQGERAIQSDVRDIRFGGDYFFVQDSVWNGRAISTRRMFIKSSEILWLVEDESSVVLRLKN